MARVVRTKIVRISEDLDKQIRDISKQSKIKYVDASKEIARFNINYQNRKLFKEVKF